MALLQISEPGQTPDPHQRRLAVGIDLGTTNSLVATVRSGSPEVLLDARGEALLPSVVRYGPEGVVVGRTAMINAATDPTNTIVSVKRLMGRGHADASMLGGPYQFVDNEQGMVRIRTRSGPRTPVEVSAEILRQLRQRAELSLGGELEGAVITVPAYFDDNQRQATKDAAELAGLKVLRLLSEPTAAAIAYGLDHGSEGLFAVYDLGGGTFDISILRLSRGVFEVIATGGDSALGGDDFDRCIVDWALRETGVSDQLDPGDYRMMLTEACRVKEALSSAPRVTFSAQLSDATRVRLPLTHERLANLVRPLVERTLRASRGALRDAELSAADILGVVMVGGATRMPVVRHAVRELFGREPLIDLDPDKVVALGAALQANLLVGNTGDADDWLLLDVIPLSLGLETMGGLVERIIPRNATIPVARAQEFTTFRDGQSAIAIHVVQGEREMVEDCRSLARFELRGIPPMTAGAARIRVVFQVDADGLLSVSACETGSGVKASVSVKPSFGLPDGEIARMLRASFDGAAHDMQARALREQQVDAQRLIEATQAALAVDGDLLGGSERATIEQLASKLARAAEGSDREAIRHAIEAMSIGTESFAARRMDRAIAKALAGRRVEDI